ncbi:hypothetical protein TNCV_3005991 [Trichonephila clavipes]|nr:hypothetical protein TNCV_3005991 [Trichonephila clavipes]
MALPQLPLVGLLLSPTQGPLSAWSDNLDGESYAIFMAFRAISAASGQNIVIFIDSHAAIKTAYLATIYSHQNLSSSANILATHFFAPEERSFSNGSHLIATSRPKKHRLCSLPMPLRNAKRLLRDTW